MMQWDFAFNTGMVAMMVLFGFLSLFLFIYVIYDLAANQDHMQGLEKAIWIIGILVFNFFGILAYIIVVMISDTYLLDTREIQKEQTRIDQLERLTALHEKGELTDNEFREEKKRILEDADDIG